MATALSECAHARDGASSQAIPLFVFNVPEIGIEGGPLRPDGPGTQFVVNGSMDERVFVDIFDELWTRVEQARAAHGGARRLPPPLAPDTAAADEKGATEALLGQRVSLHGLLGKLNPRLNLKGKLRGAAGGHETS